MKKITLLIILLLIAFIFAYQKFGKPASKAIFTEDILTTPMVDFNDNPTELKYVLSELKGKVTLIDIWASWCGDCIKSLPKVEAFKHKYGDRLNYLYLSVDKVSRPWQKSITSHNIKGRHFRVESGWDKTEAFSSFLSLDWIPRYLLIDKEGNIAHFYSKTIEDKALIEKVDQLINYQSK